jgi:gamma-glutamyltranspeptidase/glutathione hydrolase
VSRRAARPIVRGRRGVIACGHPLAAGAGIELFAGGGNAVDAAVGAAAVLGVVLPDACGVGGDAFLLVAREDETRAFNGSGPAPQALTGLIPGDGGGTVAVPGGVAALCAAHGEGGALPLERVLLPAVRLAEDGFPVGEHLLEVIEQHRARLERGAPSWPLLDPELRPGDLVRLPKLASLLEEIGGRGPDAFYVGVVADRVAAAATADGGVLAASDLHGQRTKAEAPVRAQLGDLSVEVAPPVSQALLLVIALQWLARHADGASPEERTHFAVEAIEAAFTYRAGIAVPGAEIELVGTAVADTLGISPTRAKRRGGPGADGHTSAAAAADAGGTVVSLLVSVFDDFGAATLVPEYDFLLNDRLRGFASDGPNAVRAGARPVHTLSPLIVRHGRSITALATPGADGQVQTLLQLVEAIYTEGESLQQALERPRWRSVDGRLLIEDGFDPALAEALTDRGHLVETRQFGDGLFGAGVVARADLRRRTLEAASDVRREAWAGGC